MLCFFDKSRLDFVLRAPRGRIQPLERTDKVKVTRAEGSTIILQRVHYRNSNVRRFTIIL
jgi:hypothetical protein